MRESKLTWSDCNYMHRLLGMAQDELMIYAVYGFKKTGLHDDLNACVALINLRNQIDKLLPREVK